MVSTEIIINNIPYKSIGSYIDNNDGIDAYMPEEDSVDVWIDFLKQEGPLIALWTLSALQSYGDINSEFRSSLVHAGGKELILFLKKYCWDNDLDDIFIDFNFGRYASHNLKGNFPVILYHGKLVEQEYFEFNNDVFIETEKIDKFENDINTVINVIMNNMNTK